MPNARQKILNFIIEQQSTTVEELSNVFKVTPANIRHHLSILTGQGSVKAIGQKAAALRGRPAQIYSCTQQYCQNNLDHLTEALLSICIQSTRPDELLPLLKTIASQMVVKFPLDIHNPTRRVYSSIRALNHMSYQAHWEAHVENPRIMLGHCPYRAILDHHPEICQMDALILEELLGTPVKQLEKLELNAKSLPQCIFLINQPAW
jgi:predicted ArsR family transcriptional regulator